MDFRDIWSKSTQNHVVSGVVHIENTPPKPKNPNFTVKCFPAQLKVSMD